MGVRRGDGHLERFERVFPGDERRPFLLDRVEEVLELSCQRLLLPDVDFLSVVFQRDLIQIERIQGAQGARADGDGLLRVVDLDEVLEARQGEPADFHRGEPVYLDETVDAVLEAQQDVRVILESRVDLPASQGEDALDRRADEIPKDIDLVDAEIHHDADVADPAGERTHAPRRRGHQIAVLPFLEVPLHDRDRRIVSFDMSHGERHARVFRRVDDSNRVGHRRGEWLLDEEGDPRLDRGQSDLRMALGRHADADRVEFLLEQMSGVGVVRHVETVRCVATRLHVRVRDADQVRDLRVYAGVVLAHRADPDDSDAHRRRHRPAKEASGYKRRGGGADDVEAFKSGRAFCRVFGATMAAGAVWGRPVYPHHATSGVSDQRTRSCY